MAIAQQLFTFQPASLVSAKIRLESATLFSSRPSRPQKPKPGSGIFELRQTAEARRFRQKHKNTGISRGRLAIALANLDTGFLRTKLRSTRVVSEGEPQLEESHADERRELRFKTLKFVDLKPLNKPVRQSVAVPSSCATHAFRCRQSSHWQRCW